MEYFIILNAVKQGPYSLDEVVKKIKAGEINSRTQVWHVGLTDWVHLENIADLKTTFEESPPPPRLEPVQQEVIFHERYGGFWRRLGAFMIDSIILIAATKLIMFILWILGTMLIGTEAMKAPMQVFEDPNVKIVWENIPPFHVIIFISLFATLIIINIIGPWIYYAGMESSSWQATLGKRMLNMKVVDLNGRRINFPRATGRYFAKIISSLIFCLGFFMIGWTRRKQGLHDKLAETLVILNPPDTIVT